MRAYTGKLCYLTALPSPIASDAAQKGEEVPKNPHAVVDSLRCAREGEGIFAISRNPHGESMLSTFTSLSLPATTNFIGLHSIQKESRGLKKEISDVLMKTSEISGFYTFVFLQCRLIFSLIQYNIRGEGESNASKKHNLIV